MHGSKGPGPGRVFFVLLALVVALPAAAEDHAAPPSSVTAEAAIDPAAPPPASEGAAPPVTPSEAPPPPPAYKQDLVGPEWPLPPAPPQDAVWDWVQTTSGEWLKGRIKVMNNDVLEFDSDEFELQKLDWEDVKQLRSARMMAVFYDESSMVLGYLTTGSGTLVVDGPERQVRVPLANVVSIGMGTQVEKDYWSANVSLGANFRAGNINETDVNMTAAIKRRTARSSFQIDYRGNYSRRNDIESSNDHRVQVWDDILLSRSWFVRPATLEFYRDDFQNIDQQWTLGVGGGYFLVDNELTRWVVVAGPGYQRTRYVTVQAGEDLDRDTPALLLGTDLEHEVNASVDLEASYQLTLVNQDAGQALQSALVAVDIDLTALLDLRVSFSLDRIEQPEPDVQGNVPEQNDARLTIGLDYEI